MANADRPVDDHCGERQSQNNDFQTLEGNSCISEDNHYLSHLLAAALESQRNRMPLQPEQGANDYGHISKMRYTFAKIKG